MWVPSREKLTLVTPCACARSYLRKHCPVRTFHTCRHHDSDQLSQCCRLSERVHRCIGRRRDRHNQSAKCSHR